MAPNASLEKAPRVDDWLRIDTDGRLHIRTGKVDIGQRVSTALAIIAADELDVPLEKVEIVRADTDSAPNEGITSGSNSMEESGNAVRLASGHSVEIICCSWPQMHWRSMRIRWTYRTV